LAGGWPPFGGCLGLPSEPTSPGGGAAWAIMTGAVACAAKAELAIDVAVRAVVASSTKRILLM